LARTLNQTLATAGVFVLVKVKIRPFRASSSIYPDFITDSVYNEIDFNRNGEPLMTFLKLYLIAFVVFFAIDMVWLGLIAKNLYSRHLGFIMAPQVKWVAAIVFYLLFIVGLVFFVIQPAIVKDSLTYAIFAGLLFGLITYATYDLTNLATLNNWPITITIIDLAWGSFLGMAVSTITFLLGR
jgi:uncharacterized membrane protein